MNHRFPTVLMAVTILVFVSIQASAVSPKTRRLSVRTNGTEGNEGSDGYIDNLSNNGRIAVFASSADNLVANDGNLVRDVFVHNMRTDVTERVSVSSAGEEADAQSNGPAISGNGRYAAYHSEATNLVGNDGNGFTDIFVRDLKTDKTRRVSVRSNGTEGSNAVVDQPDLSWSGRFVVFATYSQLVGKDDNDDADIYLRDTEKKRTMLITKRRNGNAVTDGNSQYPTISEDGRLIAFESSSDELVPGDNNGQTDAFLFNRNTGNTRRISVKNNGNEIMKPSRLPSISGNGELISFDSDGKLTRADDNSFTDIYLWNRNTGTRRLISKDSNGNSLNNETAYSSISPNGRMIGFYSYATDVINNDPSGQYSAYVHDRKRDKNMLVDRKTSGEAGDGRSYVIGISGDGRFVLIATVSALVGSDNNGVDDVYRRGPLY